MSKNKTVIALGLFDSMHVGHRKVIEKAVKIGKKNRAKVVVFSFTSLPNKPYYDKMIYSTEIRKEIMLSLGVDAVHFEEPTKEFLSQNKEEFLNLLNEEYDIYAYVVGEDYTFGVKGEGNADFLRQYAKKKGQKISVSKLVKEKGEKISTTLIKECLKKGETEKVNKLLASDYKIEGIVKSDRKVGTKMLYPTVNIEIDDNIFPIKNGVYFGYVVLDKKYKAVINIGNRPTFDLQKKLIEAHILSFNGDLYGKKITVFLRKFLRDTVKFDSVEELKEQIGKDIEKAKGIKL